MSVRGRVVSFVAVLLVVVIGAGAYAIRQGQASREQRSTRTTAAQTSVAALDDSARIVFRHTGKDDAYGTVAMVPLDEPEGARAFTGVTCDRVAAWSGGASCLVARRGVVTRFEGEELGPDWEVTASRPLPGIPSRTRVSADGTLVATTSFVTGHSYMSAGFSTTTEVHTTDGSTDWGDLEDFALTLDGRRASPSDRNVWGVTFVDDRTFYATVGTGGATWLVEGDLVARTLTSVTSDAECPSVSPDRTQVAFKVDLQAGSETVWGLAVLDLASGRRTVLDNGPRGVDDQVEWLDDDTLLYGLPRADDTTTTDVWAVDTAPAASPRVLIEHAWSPTVVR